MGLLELCNEGQAVLGTVGLAGLTRARHSLMKVSENLPVSKVLTPCDRYPTRVRKMSGESTNSAGKQWEMTLT